MMGRQSIVGQRIYQGLSNALLPLRTSAVMFSNNKEEEKVIRFKRHSEVYKPFESIAKNSPEYYELARTGKVWEDYFQPFKITEADLQYQASTKRMLEAIDAANRSIDIQNRNVILESMKVQLTHQSLQIEGAGSSIGDTEKVYKKLYELLPSLHDAEVLPSAAELLPDKPETVVIEIRNHLIALDELLMARIQDKSLTEEHVKHIHKILFRDTEEERVDVWGKTVKAGAYRPIVMQSYDHPDTIYPYPLEIPALMERFYSWRDSQFITPSLHPILISTKILLAFFCIHPFVNGNGRMGRLLFADALLQFGYLPPSFQNFQRNDYIDAVYKAANGNPSLLYNMVVETERDMVSTITDTFIM